MGLKIMDIFFYLSCLVNVLLAITCIYSTKVITLNSLHKGGTIIYVLSYSLFPFVYRLNLFLAFLLILIYTLMMHYFLNHKTYIINTIVYLIFYYLIAIFLKIISPSIKIINGILFLTSYKGLLASLFIPLFGLIMLFSSIIIDKTFHLHNYQDEMRLTIGNKTIKLKAYFDTGNTLTYKNIPVIFLSNANNLFFNEEFNEEIIFDHVSSCSKAMLAKGLIGKINDNEEYFVYVANIMNKNNFHGCELLLNAYLF